MALYLVTGAAGFIGTALCRKLQHSGHRVRAILHHTASGPWNESYTLDICRDPLPPSCMDGVEGIFHCAGAAHFRGLTQAQQQELWQLNVTATGELIAAASRAKVPRMVYFSSVQAAGTPGEQLVDESWQQPPDNLYGQSKLAAEELVQKASGTDILHTVILRPCLVYGAGVKGNLQRMLQAIASGRMPPLPESHKQRSMVALENLVDAAWLAMDCEAARGRLYIVCDDQPYSTRALYEAMHLALGRTPPNCHLPLGLFQVAAWIGDLGNRLTDNSMPWDSSAYQRLFGGAHYSAARLKRELNWQARQDFSACLPAMVAGLGRKQQPGDGRN